MVENEGRNDSDAIPVALHEAAERRRRTSVLRAEAKTAGTDEADRTEARRVRALMDSLVATWPED
ncbi:MAG TPA: hypothetical protein VFL66_03780 [Gaiellaceae bacterium]|nr:hypothetical protein [Gaiellaceae bacterium]